LRFLQALVMALGAFAVVGALIGLRRMRQWETLSPRDAEEGDFVALADGVEMHYVARGPADASPATPALRLTPRGSAWDSDQIEDVILIHGVMDSAQNWNGNLDALAQTRRVWAIDLIGFGFSSRPTRAAYSLRYFAETVDEFMDAQRIARAHVVGHSLGGAVALEFAARFPERVGKMVLINPGLYRVQLPPLVNWVARVPVLPRGWLGLSLSSRAIHNYAFSCGVHDPAAFAAGYAEWRRRPTRVKGTVDALIAMAANWTNSDLDARLNQLATPTLILAGENDAVVPSEHGRRIARQLRNAEFRVLPRAGHLAYEEFPPLVNQMVLEFLRE
jgi:pimeloyl-ACP methyl ester carboxylesterase